MFGMRNIPSVDGFDTSRVASAAVLDGSAHLAQTFSSDNGDTWSLSMWLNIVNVPSVWMVLFHTDNRGLWYSGFFPRKFDVNNNSNNTTTGTYAPGVWTHALLTGNGSLNKLYIGGNLTTLSGSPNISNINSNIAHYIGAGPSYNSSYANNFTVAQVVFVDGTELAPNDVLDLHSHGANGQQYVPKADKDVEALAAAGGGNSFALTSDIATGQDSSGKGNHFTVSGTITETTNTPSNPHAILNVLSTGQPSAVSDNAKTITIPNGTGDYHIKSTVPMAPGVKWYFEAVITSSVTQPVGICHENVATNDTASLASKQAYTWRTGDGSLTYDGALLNSSYGTAPSDGDRIGIALDLVSGNLYFRLNGTWQAGSNPETDTAPAVSAIDTSLSWFACTGRSSSLGTVTFYFDENEWSHTAPSGYQALRPQNLPTPQAQGADVFNTLLYTGNGLDASFTGVGFRPDWLWFKSRAVNSGHRSFDVLRNPAAGDGDLRTNTTAAEGGGSCGVVPEADGFSFDVDVGTSNEPNDATSGSSVAWLWKAGGAGVSNTDGSIASTVSVAPEGHFSIVTHTGNGVAGSTIGHGLGSKPDLIISKCRTSVTNWAVGATPLGTNWMQLNNRDSELTDSTIWNSTEPDASVFTVGSSAVTNTNGGDYVTYCFNNTPGLLKVGLYAGNGSSDGPFIYTGFKPALVIIKNITNASDWWIYDTARSTLNPSDVVLNPNANSAEAGSGLAYYDIDILPDGLKVRTTQTGNTFPNASGNTYLCIAVAEIAGGGNLPLIFGS